MKIQLMNVHQDIRCRRLAMILVVLSFVTFLLRRQDCGVDIRREDTPRPPVLDGAGGNAMAKQDSFNFFNDVPDKEWSVRKRIANQRINRGGDVMQHGGTPAEWYMQNWDPNFSCAMEDKFGNVGESHKWLCDPHRFEAQPCVIYSVGSQGDFIFEVKIQERLPNCEIHVFDFKDYTDHVPKGLTVSLHQWGLKPSYDTDVSAWGVVHGAYRGKLWNDDPKLHFLTLEETMQKLGHKKVDVFKIDCEGCEWQTYKDWIKADLRQLLVEVHEVPPIADMFFQDIRDAGYVIFHKEPNTLSSSNGSCQEYGFLKMAPSFFK